MNKTVSINLSGIVFQIDEFAYNKLNNYLESVKARFSQTEGSDEIISDIEARIAEMFSEKVNSTKQVITMDDVESMINLMGKPEDFEDSLDEPTMSTSASASTSGGPKRNKRLYRDEEESVLGGVCAGLSAYIGIDDPIWIRLIFVAVTLAGGWGIPIYILLWIIVPKAETTSQRLEMRGEDINISNIEKTVTSGADDVKKKINEIGNSEAVAQTKSGFQKLLGLAARILEAIFTIIVKILGVVFIIKGGSLLITGFFLFLVSLGLIAAGVPEIFQATFLGGWQSVLGTLGLVLVIGIPGVALIWLGLRILFGETIKLRNASIGMAVAWTLGWIMLFAGGTWIAAKFSNKTGPKEAIELVQPSGNTLYLHQLYDPEKGQWEQDELFFGETVEGIYHTGDEVIMEDQVQLDIVKSNTDNFEMLIYKSARGTSKSDAADRAGNITYEFTQNDTLMNFSSLLKFASEDEWRMQEVEIILRVPEGKSVFIGEDMNDIIYDIKNVTNTWDGHMTGHTWEMKPKGLTCLDCDFSKTERRLSGDFVTERYAISDFDMVDISGAFKVDLIHGIEYDVQVKAEPSDLDNISVEKRGNVLKIEPDRDLIKLFNRNLYQNVVIEITTPELSEIEFSGATDATVEGFELTSLTADISGATECKMNIDVEDLDLEISGASKVRLSGNGTTLKAELSGASNLKARDFACHKVSAEISGASNATVHAIGSLSADVSGASQLSYKGSPEIDSDVSGFSSIKPLH